MHIVVLGRWLQAGHGSCVQAAGVKVAGAVGGCAADVRLGVCLCGGCSKCKRHITLERGGDFLIDCFTARIVL